MEKNILVIGNGFDIYHGLDTKYYDFVYYTRQIYLENKKAENKIIDLCGSNMFIRYFQEVAKENQGWIDCELEIEMISDIFNKILNVGASVDDGGYLTKEMITRYEKNVLKFATKYISSGKFNEKYTHDFKKINRDLMLRDLNNDLNDLIEVFYYYLQQEIIKKPVEFISKQIKDIEFSYVINFNYTNTYRLYNIEDKDVCFIHGSVTSGADSIVLGTRDIENENLDFIYFRKYFQRIQKKADLLDRNRFKPEITDHGDINFFYPQEDNVNAYFFGHSLSKTDGDMIKEIIKSSNKVIIFYYDSADYEQKVINLIDVFGKKKALGLINGGKADFIQLEPAQKV